MRSWICSACAWNLMGESWSLQVVNTKTWLCLWGVKRIFPSKKPGVSQPVDELVEKTVFNRINSMDHGVTQTNSLQSNFTELWCYAGGMRSSSGSNGNSCVKLCSSFNWDNYANNLYHCSLVLKKSCNALEEILIITSNYTGMRITGNLQVVIILFIIFKAIKTRNAVFIV